MGPGLDVLRLVPLSRAIAVFLPTSLSFMTQRVHMLNTHIDNLNMQETVQQVHSAIREGKQLHHVVVNAGKLVSMQSDLRLRESVNSADIINADGMAVVWASKVLGKGLKERVAGIDLMHRLVQDAANKGQKIFLLGAKEEIVSRVAQIYTDRHGEQLVAGYRNGYFKKEEEAQIAQQIADSGAQLLFVAITSPKKENFLNDNKHHLATVNFVMGVGGSFDVIAGLTKRAPLWMQNNGLEWFYRLIQEPGRMWKRYLVGNSKFVALVLREKFKKA